jgi:PAS domain S-box-containing protein
LEIRRQFHRTPVALGRCTRDGALTHFNRAFADLVGYRNPSDLRGPDFAKTVFESPDDLSWLIERCLSTHAKESVETAWKRRNGERVVVRLSALESTPDVIEIAAEDITDLRVLQERLGRDDQAHSRGSGLWALGSRLWARVRGSN